MGMIPRCEAGHNGVNFYLIQHKSYHKYHTINIYYGVDKIYTL